jgi:VWFA-related protein
MKTSSFIIFGCLLTPVSVLSGTAQDTSKPQIPTITTKSRIVVVDVVVTDSKDIPIHHLQASDFTLLENNQPQTIRHFDEHIAVPSGPPTTPEPKMPPNTFTNFISAPQGSALNVILLDVLNTPLESQPFLRSQLKVLADALPSGSSVAIFGLSNNLVMLQSFTSDPAVLKTILTQRRHMPSAASIQPSSTPQLSASDQALVMTPAGDYEASPYNPGSPLALFDRAVDLAILNTRVDLTVTALTQISQYLASLPGRKNLLWVSGGFPFNFIPNTDSGVAGGRVFDNAADFSDQISKLSTELARSQVAVYPVDPRGVPADAAYSAALPTRGRGAVANDPDFNSRMSATLSAQLISEHATMNRLADETGGRAFYGTNDVAGAMKRATNLGANYYTLTYIPSNANWNGEFRKIKVNLDNSKHYHLAYRTGYVASDRPVTANNQQTTPESHRTEASTIAAMKRGAPNPTEILFKILVTPSSVINPPAQTNQPKEGLAAVSLHAQRRYRIDYAVDPEDIHWELDHGIHSGTVEFMIIGSDGSGNVINQASRTVSLKLTEQNYAAAVRGGLLLSQELAMPAKGEFYLRVGVLDKNTNRIGALEVSTSALQFSKP